MVSDVIGTMVKYTRNVTERLVFVSVGGGVCSTPWRMKMSVCLCVILSLCRVDQHIGDIRAELEMEYAQKFSHFEERYADLQQKLQQSMEINQDILEHRKTMGMLVCGATCSCDAWRRVVRCGGVVDYCATSLVGCPPNTLGGR